MRRHILVSSVLSMFTTFLFLGCGDRREEDYNRDQVAQKSAEFQKVSGVYTGDLISKLNRTKIGTVTITLEPYTELVSGGEASTVGQQLGLRGQVLLRSPDLSSAGFSGAFYNPSSGELDASLSIPRANGKPEPLKISGILTEDTFEGSIEAVDYPERGGSFDLRKTDPNSTLSTDGSQFGGASLHGPGGDFTIEDRSRWVAPAGDHDVFMTIVAPTDDMSERFVTHFVPLRYVDLILDMRELSLGFPNSVYDVRTGSLRGSLTLTESTVTNPRLRIDCQNVLKTETQPEVWNCRYTSLSTGIGFTYRFTRLPEEKSSYPR